MRWGLFPHEALTRSAYEQRQRQMLTTDWAVYHSNKLGNYAAWRSLLMKRVDLGIHLRNRLGGGRCLCDVGAHEGDEGAGASAAPGEPPPPVPGIVEL